MMTWYFASGDLEYFWTEQLRSLSWLPQIWHAHQGFGFNGLLSLWLDYPFRLMIKLLSTIGISWFFIEKILWLSVFSLAVYSSHQLAVYVLGKSRLTILTSIIYTANTYLLLLFSGGQLGVAWAYAFSPWVVQKFMETVDNKEGFVLRRSIEHGLFLALLIAFDLRIAYLVVGALGLYALLNAKGHIVASFLTPFFVAATIHLYWILPTVLASRGTSSLGEQFTNPGMLKFLSFADFPHALSLLHPNWPENLFGKVYFLQPEFLVLPIFAFSTLLFLKSKTASRSQILFFAALALVGVFFAKGVNEPFGQLFHWMFERVPGFVMFRDPTKFYLYTAMGYSVLIPFALRELCKKINSKIILIGFLVFWLFVIRALFTGQVKGNVRLLSLPAEYVQLKNLLVSDPVPSRTLWIPTKENFAYSSDVHPLLVANDLYTNASLSAVINIISTTGFTQTLANAGVKYVIIPEDLGKRMFLNDYTFDQSQRDAVIAALAKSSLIRNSDYHGITVYENNAFSMKSDVPADVARQQKLAVIGVAISALFLVGWLWSLKVS